MDELTRLFLAARDGDRTALLQAVRASQADVWRLAPHLVGRDEADDVTQDTFVRAWRALPAFRGDSSARTWLLAIARRACADAVAAHVRRRRLAGQVEHAARRCGDGAPATRQRRPRARARWSTGSPRDQRVAFVLTQMVGCSYAEAAEACGVPGRHHPLAGGACRERLVDTLRRGGDRVTGRRGVRAVADRRGAGRRRLARDRQRGARGRPRARRPQAHELRDGAAAV